MKDSECVQVLDLKRETFIRGYKIPNRISDDLIEWFKSNKDRHSKVNRRADITDKNTTIKKSTDISVNPDDLKYEPVSDYVEYLNACIEEYIKCYPSAGACGIGLKSSFNIQWYRPKQEGYFARHHERSHNETACDRVLVFMTYLQDLEDGGTHFPEQDIKLISRKSTTWIWPADFTHPHYGEVASDDKYIATGWIEYMGELGRKEEYDDQQVDEENRIEFKETVYEQM